ncbi:hypothetical protein [Hymenobacter psychrophilus]|uniref:hypothetical protein n=1 Tax=Hymenobacter psychrophilus TaxID=651662 RepID=UPI0011149023|nr:hypothetical protein [Hymenobacter psychrophilus]
MSSRTPFILNFLLTVPVIGLSILFDDRWGALLGVMISSLLVIVANTFMCAKAIWKREYVLAIIYFVIAFSVTMFFTSIKFGKIGG